MNPIKLLDTNPAIKFKNLCSFSFLFCITAYLIYLMRESLQYSLNLELTQRSIIVAMLLGGIPIILLSLKNFCQETLRIRSGKSSGFPLATPLASLSRMIALFLLTSAIIMPFLVDQIPHLRGLLAGIFPRALFLPFLVGTIFVFSCTTLYLIDVAPPAKGLQIFYPIFALCLSAYLFFVLYNTEWILGDDFEFIATTVRGHARPLAKLADWGSGRFFPFAHMKYNWLVHTPWYRNPLPYYLQNAGMLLASFVFLYIFLKDRCASSTIFRKLQPVVFLGFLVLLSIPRFIMQFADVIYPESSMIFLISVFVFTFNRALQSNKRIYFALAFLTNSLTSYHKEPYFTVGLAIATCFLALQWRASSRRAKVFYFSLVANSLVFLFLYWQLAYQPKGNYSTTYGQIGPWLRVIAELLISTRGFLLLPFFWVVWRSYKVLFLKDRSLFYIDTLLVSGFAYSTCYLLLRLTPGRYQVPALFIIYLAMLLYLLHYITMYQNNKKSNARKKMGKILFSLFFSVQFFLSATGLLDNFNNLRWVHLSRKATPFLFQYLGDWVLEEKNLYLMSLASGQHFSWHFRLVPFFLEYWADRRSLGWDDFSSYLSSEHSMHAIVEKEHLVENWQSPFHPRIYGDYSVVSTAKQPLIALNDSFFISNQGIQNFRWQENQFADPPKDLYYLGTWFFAMYSTEPWPDDIAEEAEFLFGKQQVYTWQDGIWDS